MIASVERWESLRKNTLSRRIQPLLEMTRRLEITRLAREHFLKPK
jgi:hypothetical protein